MPHQFYRLTTPQGIIKDYFIESCAELFRLAHGGTIEVCSIEEFKSA